MATIALYNHTRKLFANGEVNLADLKLMLLNGHTFTASHTNISSISANQVSGNGWAAGGEVIASPTIAIVNTNQARLDATDISVTATGGAIGPTDGAVIYQDTVGFEYPLFYITFSGSKTADDGAPFNVTWDASGITTWS